MKNPRIARIDYSCRFVVSNRAYGNTPLLCASVPAKLNFFKGNNHKSQLSRMGMKNTHGDAEIVQLVISNDSERSCVNYNQDFSLRSK